MHTGEKIFKIQKNTKSKRTSKSLAISSGSIVEVMSSNRLSVLGSSVLGTGSNFITSTGCGEPRPDLCPYQS